MAQCPRQARLLPAPEPHHVRTPSNSPAPTSPNCARSSPPPRSPASPTTRPTRPTCARRWSMRRGRLHRGRRERDRVVPRAAQRPAARLAALASRARAGPAPGGAGSPPRKTASSTRRSIRSAVISRCRSSTLRTGLPSTATTRSSGRSPRGRRRRAGDHLDDLDARSARARRRARGSGRVPPAMPSQARRTGLAHQRRDDRGSSR